MRNRSLSSAVLTVVALLGFGCSGGGDGAGLSRGQCAQGGQAAFCLVSCSLGCTNLGCTITDIAPNQPILLTFNQPVDPTLVDFSTISIKTASGRTPEGRFVVRDRVVEFKPEIKVIGGQTAFGFIANETYVLNLPDASDTGQVLKSIKGDPLSQSLVCTLRVSQDIIDLDQAPPRARLVTPSELSNVPKSTVIVLEFSEIIDIAPFQGATTQTSPVQYLIRKTRPRIPNGPPEDRICDVNSARQVLEGLPQAENDPIRAISIVTLRPTVPLPSQVCIEVVVTGQVRDLAGTAAVEHSFTFTTEILVAGEGKVEETFGSDGKLDKRISSGVWGGNEALPPRIGGVGELGEFNIAAGTQDPGNQKRYVWNTDSQLIPGAFTPTGKDITVIGGVFEFTRFELKEGQILAFTGSNHAQIRVRGECVLNGRIEANAPVAPYFFAADASSTTPTGGVGGAGNCGGAKGGQGGDSCQNTGADPRFNGRAGEVVVLPSGNGYATEASVTGGKGSPLFPAAGTNNQYCALTNVFCGLMGVGGGGGGFVTAGGDGFPVVVNGVHQNPCRLAANSGSAPNSGGGVFDLGGLINNSPTGPNRSVNFYAVGGSGGGGGGSHPLLTRTAPFNKWLPGSGGAGGGGVVILRVGGDLAMGVDSAIQVKGGAGYTIDGVLRANEPRDGLFNVPTPGGGGSGGSILLQVFGNARMSGLLDTSGGDGGTLDNSPTFQTGLLARARGGDGGAGYLRLEQPNAPAVVDVGRGIPSPTAKNVGKLEDFELKGVSVSRFYSTKLTFPPLFLRYELEVTITEGQNTVRRLYSDDENVGNPNHKNYDPDYAGLASGGPVSLELQGATVSVVTGEPDLVTLGEWREYAGGNSGRTLNDFDPTKPVTGFRFRMSFDSEGGTKLVRVKRLSVFFIE